MRRASSGKRSGARRRAACGWALAILALFVCLGAVAQAPPRAESLVNRKAPEFARRDLDGHVVNLAQFRGKVVLLNFWATWCAPCQAEMPVFSRWQRAYGPQGLQVVGISMDDDAAAALRLVARIKLDYPVAMGDARLGRLYGGVLGLPLTFLIDRSGVVRARFQGEGETAEIERELKVLLDRR